MDPRTKDVFNLHSCLLVYCQLITTIHAVKDNSAFPLYPQENPALFIEEGSSHHMENKQVINISNAVCRMCCIDLMNHCLNVKIKVKQEMGQKHN